MTGVDELTSRRRSTAARSATGWLNQTPMGRPTPTVSPSRGMTAARSSARGFKVVKLLWRRVGAPASSTASATTR